LVVDSLIMDISQNKPPSSPATHQKLPMLHLGQHPPRRLEVSLLRRGFKYPHIPT
jgi:hypothetical protein